MYVNFVGDKIKGIILLGNSLAFVGVKSGDQAYLRR